MESSIYCGYSWFLWGENTISATISIKGIKEVLFKKWLLAKKIGRQRGGLRKRKTTSQPPSHSKGMSQNRSSTARAQALSKMTQKKGAPTDLSVAPL
jgi:hypothetical protein